MPNVRVIVNNVDDGATVHFNGDEIMHVDFMQNGARNLHANEGDLIRLSIQNLTGGAWHAHFTVLVDGQVRYNHSPQGWSLPGQPQAWAAEIII